MKNINEMSLDDLEKIKDILEKEFDDFWNYSLLKEELLNQNARVIKCEINGEIVRMGSNKIQF